MGPRHMSVEKVPELAATDGRGTVLSNRSGFDSVDTSAATLSEGRSGNHSGSNPDTARMLENAPPSTEVWRSK